MSQQKNPPQGEGLAANACEGSDNGAGLPARLERYSTARHRARQMHDALAALPDDDPLHVLANLGDLTIRVRECGEFLAFRHYYTVDKVRLHRASFCKAHLLCPLCAIRRSSKLLERYLYRFETVQADQPRLRGYLVTATVKNGPDLGERLRHLQGATKQLQNRRRMWLKGGKRAKWTEAAKAHGGVQSYEVTNKGNGWHPHWHAIWLCEEAPDQAALRAEWEAITGDSHQVDVTPIDQADPASGFFEVLKYACKFSELSIPDNLDAFRVLRRRRLLSSFGCLRGIPEPETLTDEPLEELPYIELFYRFVPGLGYELRRAYHQGDEPEPERPDFQQDGSDWLATSTQAQP